MMKRVRRFVLQARDIAVLEELNRYGALSTSQIAQLLFAEVAIQVPRRRLKRLHDAGFLRRLKVPHDLLPLPKDLDGQYIYLATLKGAKLVGATRVRKVTLGTLLHDLLTTRSLLQLSKQLKCGIVPDAELRRTQSIGTTSKTKIVPDGALLWKNRTLYLEMVRSSVRGGNQNYIKKLGQYLVEARRGAFRATWGHPTFRGVLTLTTSKRRAIALARLAGSRFGISGPFWFGYLDEDGLISRNWLDGGVAEWSLSQIVRRLGDD